MIRPRNAYAAPAWAAEQTTGDVGTKAVLLLLANYADEKFSCFPGQLTIAEETEQSERTVRRQLELLRELGLIRRVPRYDERGKRTSDRYYLMLDNRSTKEDVEEAKARIAARRQAGGTTPDHDEPPASEGLPATLSGSGFDADSPDAFSSTGHQLAGRSTRHDLADRSADYRPSATSTTGQPEHSLPDTGDRVTPRGTPRENSQNGPGSSLRSEPASEDQAEAEIEREDVERLCSHLADRIESNGAKRPNITQKWRDAARLMLDRDRRTEEQVIRAIDWCQADEFWRSNILSMPKLREKYDQLRLQAMRRPASAGQVSNVHRDRPAAVSTDTSGMFA